MELTDDPTQKGANLASRYSLLPHHLALRTQSTSWGRLYPKHFVGQALPKALRGAGSTQSTSWGRLYPKHFVGQALRRAFLCGVDHYSGQSFEHRRQWVVDRVRLLSSLFAIDVCAYAVMSNHYSLVLKVCPEQLDDLCEDGIMDRWCA